MEKEYRKIVEKELNIKLKKGWTIHHIDGNDNNNEINNLCLCFSNSAHRKIHYTPPITLPFLTKKETKKAWDIFNKNIKIQRKIKNLRSRNLIKEKTLCCYQRK